MDFIIQLAAPKDPAFFIHRIGRTARAGRSGGALLFVSDHERSYIELLRGRGVPLEEQAVDPVVEASAAEILEEMKRLAMEDREVLEHGSTAFMAFLRAYQEHLCSYIFRLEELDIGSVARSYGLLRLPKIPETRGRKGKPILFTSTEIDTSTIPYRHKEREHARLMKLEQLKEEKLKEQEQEESTTTKFKSEENKKKKKEWEEDFELKSDPKRKRKKKQSRHQQIMEEWDELAAEETLFRKFKKGKLSREDYEEQLMSEEAVTLPDHLGAGDGSDDDDDDENDEVDAMRAIASRIGGGSSKSGGKVFVKGDFRAARKSKGSGGGSVGGKQHNIRSKKFKR